MVLFIDKSKLRWDIIPIVKFFYKQFFVSIQSKGLLSRRVLNSNLLDLKLLRHHTRLIEKIDRGVDRIVSVEIAKPIAPPLIRPIEREVRSSRYQEFERIYNSILTDRLTREHKHFSRNIPPTGNVFQTTRTKPIIEYTFKDIRYQIKNQI